MSTKKEIVKVCDFCGKRVSDGGEITFGGHVHAGWFHIEEHGGPTNLEALRKQKAWDICSVACLKKFAVASTVCPKLTARDAKGGE